MDYKKVILEDDDGDEKTEIERLVSEFMDKHNVRWEGNRERCGSAVLEIFLIDLCEACARIGPSGIRQKDGE